MSKTSSISLYVLLILIKVVHIFSSDLNSVFLSACDSNLITSDLIQIASVSLLRFSDSLLARKDSFLIARASLLRFCDFSLSTCDLLLSIHDLFLCIDASLLSTCYLVLSTCDSLFNLSLNLFFDSISFSDTIKALVP